MNQIQNKKNMKNTSYIKEDSIKITNRRKNGKKTNKITKKIKKNGKISWKKNKYSR